MDEREYNDTVINTETRYRNNGFWHQLFSSERGENFCLKAVFGTLGGFMTGGILFVILAFSFNYSYSTAGWVTLACTVLMCLGLAFSVYFRCIIILTVPSLFTGRGRVALLSIIFTVLLTGPVMNISHNANEVAKSMSCISELAHNQSLALKKQIQEPIRKIATNIEKNLMKLQSIGDGIVEALKPVTDALDSLQNGLKGATRALQSATVKCTNGVNKVKSSCRRGINSVYQACRRELSKGEDNIKGGFEKIGKGIVNGLEIASKAIVDFFGKRKRRSVSAHVLEGNIDEKYKFHLHHITMRSTYTTNATLNNSRLFSNLVVGQNVEEKSRRRKHYTTRNSGRLANTLHNTNARRKKKLNKRSTKMFSVYPSALQRFKRCVVLCYLCEPLNIVGICGILDVGREICKLPAVIGDGISTVAAGTQTLIDGIKNFFKFNITGEFALSGGINSSKTVVQIQSEVENDIKSKTTWFVTYVNALSQFMALSLLLVFFKSAAYLKKYLAKDQFDNIYISKKFKTFDEARRAEGKTTVLPLTRCERRKYIDTTSIYMSHKELVNCTRGCVPVLLNLVIASIVIIGDYVLFYIVNIMTEYSVQAINVSGLTKINIEISGSGILSAYLRAFAQGINLTNSYDSDFNLTHCLPKSKAPNSDSIVLIAFLYFVAVIFIFLQAYGLRLRRKIVSFYYPEQERDRIQFLHKKIRNSRQTSVSWLAQYKASRKKEINISERMSFSSMVHNRCPWFAAIACNRNK